MAYYPINIDIADKLCIIVGGGEVAERKALGLIAFGARVKVVSPKISGKMRELAQAGKVEHIEREYARGDVDGALLVFAACDDPRVNEMVYEEAASKGILVNVADRPELCSFIVPSIVKRGDLVLSASTGGLFPLLAKTIRRELEKKYGPEYEEYLAALGEARTSLRRTGEDATKALKALIDDDLLRLAREGKDSELRERVSKILNSSASRKDSCGGNSR